MRGEWEQGYISKDSSRLSSSLVGIAGLQEDMVGPSQSDLECLKIIRPRMHVEKLVSALFLFAKSDLVGYAIRNELVPLSRYVYLCAHRSSWLWLPVPSEVSRNLSFVWTTSRAWQWKVEVFPNVTDGVHLCLHWGWKQLACALDLQDRFSLVLWCDDRSQINVKVFDLTTCHKQYLHDLEASGS
jgi:hypothetical protein